MVKPKARSKRMPLARRYNINKKAKEHERKQRRDAKKNPGLRKKLNKDPGIPNMNPFKADLLRKMQAQKKLLEFQDRVRAQRGQEIARRRQAGGGAGDELSGMAADAAARDAAFKTHEADGEDEDDEVVAGGNAAAGESTRRAFYRHVKQVIEKADIILEVLDARDPLGCRAYAVEELALKCDPPKRVVLVLNKIDLVPAQAVQAWLVYLRKSFPTVAFKASTQQQRSHLSAPGGAAVNKATEAGEVVTGSGAAGADTLLQLLKNYSRSHDMKTAVTVGIVGYPNVGKSSVINSLKRGRAVGVSSTPGFTRVLQEVSLDAKVTLIDCPGIIFDDGNAEGKDGGASLLLRNCISVDQIDDPEGAVAGILGRCAPEKLMALYSIPAYASPHDFLRSVAVKRGKIGKGGVPDPATAARTVLQDWNSGKIPFFVLPPQDDGSAAIAAATAGGGRARVTGGADVGTAAIVSQWTKEFGLDEAMASEDASGASAAGSSASASAVLSSDWIGMRASQRSSTLAPGAAAAAFMAVVEGEEEEEEEDEDMGDEEDEDDEEEEEEEEDDDLEEDEDEDELDDGQAQAILAGSGKGKGRNGQPVPGKAPAGRILATNAGAVSAAGRDAFDFGVFARKR